jgi:CMP-N-acetylneuraminic acid synthetase
VRIIERPKHLTDGAVPMNEVILHDVSQLQSRFYLQTHSTNPFLRPETIAKAILRFVDEFPQHDSLFTVTPLQARLWSAEAAPINHDPSELLRTQDLPPVFVENSCLYIFERDGFMQRKNRIGESPILFEVEEPEAWDIDEELDFQLAELYVEQLKASK